MRDGTLLDAFMKANAIKPAQLSRVAYVSRQHLLRVRTGEDDPTRQVMVRLLMACTLILHRRVRMDELFDLTETGL
jgi:hypothetical protein